MVNPVEPQLQSMAAAGRGDWGEAATQGAIALAPAVGGAVLGRMGANTVDDAARWLMETQVGWSPTGAALGDMGQRFAADEAGSAPVFAPFDMGGGIGHNGGPRLSALDSVDLPAHSRPEWAGAAPSRTEPYPRYTPRSTPERMARLEARVADPEDPIHGMFSGYIDKGRTLGGEDWYNTEELRDWFTESLGDTAGDAQWREFMELIGTTSTGAKVPQNIRMASFYRAIPPGDRIRVAQRVKELGITPAKAAEELGVKIDNLPDNYAYGHIKQRNQASNVVNREAGLWDREVPEDLTGAARTRWIQANPKVKGFGNDLLGDDTNIAADMHFMRMLAMSDGGGDFLTQQAKLSADAYSKAVDAIGPRRIKNYATTRMVNGKPVTEVNLQKAWRDGVLKDPAIFKDTPTAWADTPRATEYAAYENMAGRVAAEYGMTPAQFQASLWMGAGDMTGLADESQGTFMELFRRSLDKRASERGISRREMLDDFIQNRAPLAVAGTGLAGMYAAGSGTNALAGNPYAQD